MRPHSLTGLLLVTFLCLFGTSEAFFNGNFKGVNGAIPCAACTIAVGLVEQLAQVHNSSITQTVNDVCDLLPISSYRNACKDIINSYGPTVIDLLYAKATPDIVCHALKFCITEPGQPVCHLFPLPKNDPQKDIQWAKVLARKRLPQSLFPKAPFICKLPGIKFICDLIHRLADNHLPVLDMDLDGFSTIETLRGTSWRGKDCNDFNPEIHPGARPIGHDRETDSNCNGIYGVDPASHQAYEDQYCGGTGSLGVAVLGDSAGAHFHIPPQWIFPKTLNKDMLTNLPYVVENEMDWPMMSATTGYKNITWPIIQGPVHSVYSMLRDRNRCNHRDFQNIAVNGARVGKMQNIQLSLSRDPEKDHPMLIVFALLGNDVCNGHPDTVAHMTTPAVMRDNFIKTLMFLEGRIPLGSHLLVVGLADGRVLYDNMYKRFHPFGHLNSDVTYPDFYSYLNCLQISPCTGWMTTNDTIRELTYQRVVELNAVLKDVSQKFAKSFDHFDIEYVDCPLMPVLKQWEKDHGPHTGWQLIEPVDGFHPNTYAETLSAQYTWNYLLRKAPHFLGNTNPHNRQIMELFGDQGGY